MTPTKTKSAAQQRRQGWIIIAVAAALVIGRATGFIDWQLLFG